MFTYVCSKCGYTVTYEDEQKAYMDGFVCGGHEDVDVATLLDREHPGEAPEESK